MFHLDTAFATELLVLAAGAALLGWSGYTQVHAKKLVQAIAYAVIVLSILTMLCTAYYGLKYTRMGYFKTPAGMMHHGMMGEGMMKNGMIMQGGDKGGMMSSPETSQDKDATPEEPAHSHDH